MAEGKQPRFPEILKRNESELLPEWVKEQLDSMSLRLDLLNESELREQSYTFLRLFQEACQSHDFSSPYSESWQALREYLGVISRTRATLGFNPSETATFIFSLKQPLFRILRRELGAEPIVLVDEIQLVSNILDMLGLYTTEVYQRSREEIISRQQMEMLELSTPVVSLWDGIVALPMIGTLDSARTQVVMESLLQKIVETGSDIAIIDITGVPTVDTLVAQHLLKAVAAARLMGADCIISGIRPQIAQTMVHLAIDLSHVTTKATLADAFRTALMRISRGSAMHELARSELAPAGSTASRSSSLRRGATSAVSAGSEF